MGQAMRLGLKAAVCGAATAAAVAAGEADVARGTSNRQPHLPHRPCLPASWSGALSAEPHLGQVNGINLAPPMPAAYLSKSLAGTPTALANFLSVATLTESRRPVSTSHHRERPLKPARFAALAWLNPSFRRNRLSFAVSIIDQKCTQTPAPDQ